MKRIYILTFLSVLLQTYTFSQGSDAALKYLNNIAENSQTISQKFMSYSSAVAHSNRARKVENRRIDLIKATADARNKAMAMTCFEKDCALRDSLVSYLTISYYVLNNDYAKIVNMEEVAEESYDQMEAYLNARKMATEKVKMAGDMLDDKYMAFADKHNIKIAENKSKLSRDIEKVGKVNEHYDKVYLIFFKSYKQEFYMADALNRKDYSSAEQNRNSLLQLSTEGLARLDTMRGLNNDKSLILACKRVLEFYKTEATDKVSTVIDFMLKKENYEKLEKVISTKDPMLRTQDEVNQYNKSVADLKAVTAKYNTTVNFLNQGRTASINGWNSATQNFLERYIPKYD